MYKFLRIDNLAKECSNEYSNLAKEISELANYNLSYSNDGTYDEESFRCLKKNKSDDFILKLIEKSYVICIYYLKKLVACGFLTVEDNRYFSKSLHVDPKFRGKGLANTICGEREKYLRKIGVNELYIESVKFPNTLKFHKRNGFKIEKPYKILNTTILMKKILR